MLYIPRFFYPKKNLMTLLRINAGIIDKEHVSTDKLLKSVDVYTEPLQLVFMLACAIYKTDKSKLSKQLSGVISHERFGNAMHMAAFKKICTLYNKHNIPILAEKGLVQKLQYPKSTRPMNDADFAVPRNMYRDAIDLALKNGFHINHDMLFSADLQLRNQGCVDVHYALFKGTNPKMDDEIFARAKKINVFNCDVLVPAPEDMIIIMMCEFYGNFLFEAGSTDSVMGDIFSQHPQWVLDAYKIISNTPNLDWKQIMNTAKKSEYHYQIKILSRILNKIIPGVISLQTRKIINECCPDNVVRKYLRRDKKIIHLHNINHKFYTTGKY